MGTDSASADESPGDLYKILYSWFLPVALGIPGNLMAILIASKEHNRKLSPCIYMIAMAVADTVLLLVVAWVVILVRLWDLGIVTSREYLVRYDIADTCIL
jgi:hypothetical protein